MNDFIFIVVTASLCSFAYAIRVGRQTVAHYGAARTEAAIKRSFAWIVLLFATVCCLFTWMISQLLWYVFVVVMVASLVFVVTEVATEALVRRLPMRG